MIAIQNIPHLTNPSLAFKLSPLSPHAAVWFDSHQKHKMPLARLIRRLRFHMQKIIYGGRYLGSFGSHGSCAMSVNPDNVHRPIFDRIKRCSLHFTRGHTMSQNNSVQSTTQTPIRLNQNTQRVKLSEFIKQQDQQRGLEPLPLESSLLLKRIAAGGHSGQFLASAFLSAYRTDKPFLHSLGELIKLDAEGFRLFHQVLHIRHIKGWSDRDLYQIEQQIIAIVGGAL